MITALLTPMVHLPMKVISLTSPKNWLGSATSWTNIPLVRETKMLNSWKTRTKSLNRSSRNFTMISSWQTRRTTSWKRQSQTGYLTPRISSLTQKTSLATAPSKKSWTNNTSWVRVGLTWTASPKMTHIFRSQTLWSKPWLQITSSKHRPTWINS